MTDGFHPPVEEYLETIQSLTEEGTTVIQARIAQRLGRSAPSVSEMLDRLTADGYIHRSGRTIALTEQGRVLADSVIRKHRLAERLLVDVIGLPWHKAHLEAGRWEHVISDEVEERLDRAPGQSHDLPPRQPHPGRARCPGPLRQPAQPGRRRAGGDGAARAHHRRGRARHGLRSSTSTSTGSSRAVRPASGTGRPTAPSPSTSTGRRWRSGRRSASRCSSPPSDNAPCRTAGDDRVACVDDSRSSSSPRPRNPAAWPDELVEVFERSITAEYASLTRDGRPVTVPTTPYSATTG